MPAHVEAKTSMISEREMTRLSSHTAISLSTVRRWVKGEKVTVANARALHRGAGKLGIPMPERSRGTSEVSRG